MSYDEATLTRLREESAQIMGRYPSGHERSALIPMLHLIQSYDGYVSPDGIRFCAETLNLTTSEVSAVATFYSQFRRHPGGQYHVGVCTNALCAVMGGDAVWDAVSEHLGIGNDGVTEDGSISLERIECNAACDYAPVVMVNWEFFDNQTPESACALIDDIEAGKPLHPTRGSAVLPTFKETEHVLAGFLDGHENEGPSAGEASTLGLRIAEERGWSAPADVPAEEGKEKDGE